jgi:dihydropyrimidinase
MKLLPIVHAEDNEIIEENEKKFKKEGKTEIKYHPDIRPSESEAKAIKTISELIDMINMPGYIVHLSSELGLKELKNQQKKGLTLKAETAPHYLLLNRDYLKRDDGYLYFMTPPLRTKNDNESLWQGLVDNNIDVVATDHCAFNISQKKMGNDAFNILPGIPGSETLLPLIYYFGMKNDLNLVNIINKLSTNPAKIFGLYPKKGSLQENTDADIVIFDPKKSRKLESMYMHSNSEYSPYSHIEVEGYPITTISRGNIIVNNGAYRGFRGHGKYIKASNSSLY